MSDSKKWTRRDTVAAVLLLPMLLVSMAVRRWAILVMWGWFVMPLGVRPISGSVALGITLMPALIYGWPRGEPKKAEDDPLDKLIRDFAYGLLISLATVGLGWLILRFG